MLGNLSHLVVSILRCAVFVSTVVVAPAQTAWTGAVSTDWFAAGNWTNGVPTSTVVAVIDPAPNQPSLSGFGECLGLVVAPGAALGLPTAFSNLDVYGDASIGASITGLGSLTFVADPNNPTPPPNQVVFSNQARAPRVVVAPEVDADFTDLAADRFSTRSGSNEGGAIRWHGSTTLGDAEALDTPQGRITCDPNGSLVVSSFTLEWNLDLPELTSIGFLQMNPTSRITPTTGVIRIQAGRALNVQNNSSASLSLNVEVPAASSFRFGDGVSSGSNSLTLLSSAGEITVDSVDPVVVRTARVDGTLSLVGDEVQLLPLSQAIAAPLVVAAGARLNVGGIAFQSARVRVPGELQVDGTLRVAAGATLRLEDASATEPARLRVTAAGTLSLAGSAFGGAALIEGDGNHRAVIEIDGTLGARFYRFAGLGPDGVQLRATSRIAAAPDDLRDGVFDDGATTPGSVLLLCARTAPTRFDGIAFEATNTAASRCIRATTGQAVDLRNVSGALGDEAFEDDPLAVVSWTNGVSFFGHHTAGCSGLAECRTGGEPRIGSNPFLFTTRNAPPSTVALLLIAFGGLSTPVPHAGVDVWIDPFGSWFYCLTSTSATGAFALNLPIPGDAQLIGLPVFAQTLSVEPATCGLRSLSASTAIRLALQP